MDGKLVVRKAIFHLLRRDTQAWFCLQRVTRHIYLRQSLLRYGIFLRFMGRLGLVGARGSCRVGGARGSFRVRVGVIVRFSVSVGVSVVDGK